MNTELQSDKSKRRGQEDLSTVWNIVLKQMFKKTDGNIQTLTPNDL